MTLTAVKPEPAPLDTPTMEERIATVLQAPEDVPAQTFALMLKWVRAKIVLTKQAAQEALKASLDPAVIDPGALGRAHDLEHFLQRLENAEAALTPHWQVAVKREEIENWKARTSDLQQRVTDLGQELLSVYAEATEKLVDIFKRCNAADEAVASVNNAAPDTLHRLWSVEAILTKGSTAKIIPRVKLPTLTVDGHVAPDTWPPVAVPIGVQLHDAMIASMRGARPPTEDEKIAESMRVTKYYEDQERGRSISIRRPRRTLASNAAPLVFDGSCWGPFLSLFRTSCGEGHGVAGLAVATPTVGKIPR
jgi:hypothetical protein